MVLLLISALAVVVFIITIVVACSAVWVVVVVVVQGVEAAIAPVAEAPSALQHGGRSSSLHPWHSVDVSSLNGRLALTSSLFSSISFLAVLALQTFVYPPSTVLLLPKPW